MGSCLEDQNESATATKTNKLVQSENQTLVEIYYSDQEIYCVQFECIIFRERLIYCDQGT